MKSPRLPSARGHACLRIIPLGTDCSFISTSGQPGRLQMLLDPSSSRHPTANQADNKQGIIYALLHDGFRPLPAAITRPDTLPKNHERGIGGYFQNQRWWRKASARTKLPSLALHPSSASALDNGPSSSSNPAAPICSHLLTPRTALRWLFSSPNQLPAFRFPDSKLRSLGNHRPDSRAGCMCPLFRPTSTALPIPTLHGSGVPRMQESLRTILAPSSLLTVAPVRHHDLEQGKAPPQPRPSVSPRRPASAIGLFPSSARSPERRVESGTEERFWFAPITLPSS